MSDSAAANLRMIFDVGESAGQNVLVPRPSIGASCQHGMALLLHNSACDMAGDEAAVHDVNTSAF